MADSSIGPSHVHPHHPLMELLGQLLHGIETVNAKEQGRMVSRACREAVRWHKDQVERDPLDGKPMAFAVYCPIGHEFDFLVYTEELEAQDQAGEMGTEVIPLYPKPPPSE